MERFYNLIFNIRKQQRGDHDDKNNWFVAQQKLSEFLCT